MFAYAIRAIGSWPGWWRAQHLAVRDGLLAVAVTLLAYVPTMSAMSAQIGDLPRRPPDALAVLLALAQSVPLVIRSRHPAACVAVVGSAFAVHQALAYPPTFASIGLYLSLYAAGAHQARFRYGLVAAATVGYTALAVHLHNLGSPNQVQDFLAFSLALAVMWMAGAGVRRWRAEEAERRRLSAHVAATAERARIARELHDVVTHHVTAMVVQADAAQFLVGSAPARAGDGLAAISDTGRRALTELRHLLGVLEATGDQPAADRAPTLGKVGDLVERARLSGQPVHLTELGDQLPRAVDVELAAYRVVQEALTNAVKHAAGQPTAVTVHHHEDRIEIEVTTGGPATVSAGGRGLSGLGERLRLLGGELSAAAGPSGGFRVHARIPARNDP
ncbi:histidine kinase [Acrocarpospora macrocephala]|uniref:histidine kinase n=1 Tax=Acrocarpospora macrocephala TaxID=150177 RepID=A0A5M3WLX1_9ACTN|nr:histidine kinase [Acrocarpospora macrocephala]GES09490.1 two-component sensor histidine kinase [Acrocarpospora macrocephala]